MIIRLSDLQDLMTSTLDDYGPPTFRQIAQRLQRYEIFSRWFREEKIMIQNGIGISRRLMTSHDDDNIHTGIMSEDTYSFGAHLEDMRVDWVYFKKDWGFNYYELLANRGEALLTNVVEPQRANALLNIASQIEAKGWAAPSGPSDNLVPYGVAYWVVKNASAQGFNGRYPSGFTTMAGVDLDLHPNFCNYTDGYSEISEDDAVFKLNQMKQETEFVSPLEVGGEGDVVLDNYRLYVNNETRLEMMKYAKSNNDDTGFDLSWEKGGGVSFLGSKVVNVPALNSDTSDPIYMLNHEVFKPVVREDDFLRESELERTSFNHNTYVIWIEGSYNFICEDRRREGVMSKAA